MGGRRPPRFPADQCPARRHIFPSVSSASRTFASVTLALSGKLSMTARYAPRASASFPAALKALPASIRYLAFKYSRSAAREAFRNASKSADLEYLRARYLIDAGRAYKAGGKQAEAVAVYRAVIDSFPESPSVTEAKVRLAELTDGKM